MADPPKVSNALARRLLLARQGLCRAPKRRIDPAGLQSLIEDLGFVQLDSVSTVERAHHMILFSRATKLTVPKLLTRLYWKGMPVYSRIGPTTPR